jgi:hypothetical protein
MGILVKSARYGIIFIVVVLTGCAIGKMVLNVDPDLQSNATVLEVHTPSAVAFKRSFSFGEYRVDGDSIWVKGSTQSSSGDMGFLDALFSDDSSKTIRKKTTRTHSYQFLVGENVTWDAQCSLGTQQIESASGRLTATTVLSYRYVCKYTRSNHEPWLLTLTKGNGARLAFQMSNQQMTIRTEETYGDILYKDSSRRKPLAPFITGYTWVLNDKNVGAVSVYEKPRRVWLDQDNSKALNKALAMASAGILMYYWKIGPSG